MSDDLSHKESPDDNVAGSAAVEASAVFRDIRRSRHRRRFVLVAGTVATFLVSAFIWSSGAFQQPAQTELVVISPSVFFEEQLDAARREHQPTIFHISKYVADDAMLKRIGELKSIETLIVDQGIITDEAVDVIASLPNLRHLRLRLSPITDDGLRKLAQCETLWYLNLPHAECTAQGAAALTRLPRLRQLRLGSPHLGNEVAREIAAIQSLRGIHLIGVEITDEGLSTLARMPHLESLYLDDSAVTDAGWQWLFENSPQLHVHINQAHHDRDPKSHPHHE